MKATIPQNSSLESHREEEEEEGSRLSFCDLPTAQNNSGFTNQIPITSSVQPNPLFEFFVSQPRPTFNNTVFCGKIIHEGEEYQKRDYFSSMKSRSFRRPSFSGHDVASTGELIRPNLDYLVQRVNITSLTSMSAKCRRMIFMFGPIKFKPEVDLSVIKQRRAKLKPAVEKMSHSDGGKSRWGLMKASLRGISNLTTVLGCIPLAGGGAVRCEG